MPDLEPFALYFLAAGAAVLFTGLVWLLIVAFKSGFIKKAFLPVLVVLFGAAVALFVPAMSKLFPKPIQTTAVEEQKKTADGQTERRLTLTGATRDQYDQVIAGSTTYAVIQWENADVTDEDAAKVLDHTDLRELYLNSTQVTDITLERLVRMSKLTKLYIARTKITADGVKTHILDNPDCKLTEIDVRGLNPPVPGAALREWKSKDPARKFNN